MYANYIKYRCWKHLFHTICINTIHWWYLWGDEKDRARLYSGKPSFYTDESSECSNPSYQSCSTALNQSKIIISEPPP